MILAALVYKAPEWPRSKPLNLRWQEPGPKHEGCTAHLRCHKATHKLAGFRFKNKSHSITCK